MTVKELRTQAKERNLRGYSKLRKDELIQLLSERRRPIPAPRTKIPPHRKTPPTPAPRKKLTSEPLPELPTYQSKRKETRREKRDKKNFVHSFDEDLPETNKEKRLKRLKKSLAAANKKLKKNKKERNKTISRRNNIKKEIEKLKEIKPPPQELEFEIHRGRSALRDFATVDTIDGR